MNKIPKLLILLFLVIPITTPCSSLFKAGYAPAAFRTAGTSSFRAVTISKYSRMDRLMRQYRSARRRARMSTRNINDIMTLFFILSVIAAIILSHMDEKKLTSGGRLETIGQEDRSPLTIWGIANLVIMGFALWRIVIRMEEGASFGIGFGILLSSAFILGSLGILEHLRWGRILVRISCLASMLYVVSIVLYILSILPGRALDRLGTPFLILGTVFIYWGVQYMSLRKYRFERVSSGTAGRNGTTFPGLAALLKPLAGKLKDSLKE